MSQFGGKPPGQWGRPPPTGGGSQLPGFPAVNVGAFPMVGMMGMVNQAAFSSPNMLGMQGMLGAVPQQVRQPASQGNGLQTQGANTTTSKNQRTFVGVVTKMLDTYGFVDDDVFFQHSVIRGSHPRVGDKVMVEANYNPAMPFKWNAYRIQLLNAASQGTQDSPRQPQQQQITQQRLPDHSRWSGGDRNRRSESPLNRRRQSPPSRRSPPRRPSPKRDSGRSRDLRRSPPRRSPRRSTPPRDDRSRKRDRSPTGSIVSIRRDSASPPRRRARIIPRYDCRIQRPVVLSDVVSVSTLRSRYSKLYLPSDFVDLTFNWVKTVKMDYSVNITEPVQFHIFHKDVDHPNSETLPPLEPDDADHRHQVRVLLLSHFGKSEVLKRVFCLSSDGTTDDQEPQSLWKNLNFLVGTRGKETMGIGGCWSPSLDGPDPKSPTTLIKTAIRTTKAMIGIDLSPVSEWFQMLQVRYYRADKHRIDHVHLLFPDTQQLVPDDATWKDIQSSLSDQLKKKLEEIDAMKLELPEEAMEEHSESTSNADKPPSATDEIPEKMELEEHVDATQSDEAHENSEIKNEQELSTNPNTESVNEPKEEKDTECAKDTDDGKPEESGNEPTNWSKLDPKSMKVAELRVELERRGLEIKGIKTLLVQRLQTALDSEKAAETATGDTEMCDSEANVKNESENPAAFIAPSDKETKEKAEAQAKKEKKQAEERKKKEEEFEKEKKNKKEILEKRFLLSQEKTIPVFPSKTYKNGKFDCKVVSLNSLLDYRPDDNKEYQFEVSLFAEAFKEIIERHCAFTIYDTLVNSGDKEVEKKRREEAHFRPKAEEKKEEDGEKKDSAVDDNTQTLEKKEPVMEKIDLKSVVANRTVYEAFALFDSNLCGYLLESDVEEILYNGEFGISRGQIQKLAKKLSIREKVNYRHLTDVLVDSDGNVKYTPGGADDAVDTEDLIKGYGFELSKSLTGAEQNKGSTMNETENGIIVFNGNVLNVPQKLKQLKVAEAERDAAKTKISEQASLIVQLRDAKIEMERKKKDIESIYLKANKKLNEATSQLKSFNEEKHGYKQALTDCKRYADRIFGLVDKVIPKKDEKEKSTEKATEIKEDKSSSEKEQSNPEVVIVLTDEAGDDEESKKNDKKIENDDNNEVVKAK